MMKKRKLSSLCVTLWQGEFNIKWQHLIFILISLFIYIHIVQLYKEDCTTLQDVVGCQAIALPSTEEIILSSAMQVQKSQLL